ncbi:MAG: sugar phosphate isomerase/epimerase [Planctomyces sp.]|nr:sugar phosphate isomerase/epimerase [Planctomyces sp.]
MLADPAFLTRRTFLQASAAAASIAALEAWGFADEADPYGGFKVGLQSYSLRVYDADDALKHTRTLGVRYWESFPKHVPLSTLPAQVEESRQRLADAGVTLLAYGVVPFSPDETKARELFDFAKAMDLKSLSADPEPNAETFDLLDKLVEEYDVAIGIHNHGPGHRYDKADDVLKWVRDRHPKIGACVDTGHYLRSDEDPVEVIQKFGPRVFGVHLKDVRSIRSEQDIARLSRELPEHRVNMLKREGKIFTILGEGELDVVGTLRELRKLNYDSVVALEYEESEQNPLSDIELCLASVREAVKRLD